jgi:sugar/nucleoside kinase (ribokinase family)
MSARTFLAVGHVCHDVVGDGRVLGGAAAYSSIAARNLGAESRVVTSFGEDFIGEALLAGVRLVWRRSAATTTFYNTYVDGARQQTLLGVADGLSASDVPQEWRSSDVLYLCPIADEVRPDVLEGFRGRVAGASPQGWFRQWDEAGRVSAKRWREAEDVLARVEALILSREDLAPFPEELDRFRALAPCVVVTEGAEGATVYQGRGRAHFPAYAAREVDPTGAGDVFAAAFLLHFADTGDAHESADAANCAASFAVEAVGTRGVPTVEQVRIRRLRGRA